MPEVLPAVTCTAQATLLTGKLPHEHGIVANGWLFRDTMEVRFWQQSNKLIQAEPFYETARKRAKERGRPFKCAKLFWWFNQGAAVDISVTPKPWYGYDGDKVFDVAGTPPDYFAKLKASLPPFPFSAFWGPMAGPPSTQWIAQMSAQALRDQRPDLTLVYLPHLDYDPQRFGPSGCDMAKIVKELDDACEPLLDAAKAMGTEVWIVSEYGHCDVNKVLFPNHLLRAKDWLELRNGPFGAQIDLFNSRAFAVCDHQVAHVFIRDKSDVSMIREFFQASGMIDKLLVGDERARIGLDHNRSGDLILLAKPHSWFAYNYFTTHENGMLHDPAIGEEPDFARCVAIHHKPGFDPCELFFDPKLRFPKLHAARRLLEKKLGFRTLFDVCPLDPSIVRGSHGLAAADTLDRPILVGHGPSPGDSVPMTDVRDLILRALDLD
jgi:predicted AlkP superfamily pyrophosphatase or phosphodiesterase